MIEFYNSQVDDFTDYVADRQDHRSCRTRQDVHRHRRGPVQLEPRRPNPDRPGQKYQRRPGSRRMSTYRPFTRENVWFDAELNDMVYRLLAMFPTAEHTNHGFVLVAPGRTSPVLHLLSTDLLPNLSIWRLAPGQVLPAVHLQGGRRRDSRDCSRPRGRRGRRLPPDRQLTDHTLARYRAWYGSEVTKDEIFAFVYGLLHSPEYRQRFAPDLTRSLPRIPRLEAGAWPPSATPGTR